MVFPIGLRKKHMKTPDWLKPALLPICMEQSKQDPGAMKTLADLKAASSYQRSDMVMESGWATMPGAAQADRKVANACLEQLAAQF